jgi:hypothetical protein
MTDRLKGCTVVFDHDIRDDDAEPLLNAIRMLKGVVAVEPSISTSEDYMAQERIRHEMGQKLWEVIYPKK